MHVLERQGKGYRKCFRRQLSIVYKQSSQFSPAHAVLDKDKTNGFDHTADPAKDTSQGDCVMESDRYYSLFAFSLFELDKKVVLLNNCHPGFLKSRTS